MFAESWALPLLTFEFAAKLHIKAKMERMWIV